MPIEATEKIIDGHRVIIQDFDGFTGLRLHTKFMRIIAPGVAPLVSILKGVFGQSLSNNGNVKFDLKALLESDIDKILPEALISFASSLEEKEFNNFVLEMLSHTYVDDVLVDKNTFKEIFCKKYILIYKIILEVVKVNHFFDLGVIPEVNLPKGLTPQTQKK